jgi:hypothetical protein
MVVVPERFAMGEIIDRSALSSRPGEQVEQPLAGPPEAFGIRLPFIDTSFATRGYSFLGAHGHYRQLNARGHIDLQVSATLTGTLVHIIAEQPGHMLAAACQSIHNCARLGQVGNLPPWTGLDMRSNLPAGNENGCLRDTWPSDN